MKKAIAILLMTLFTANICGASVSYHYCGKMLQYFAFNGNKKKSKCCCGGRQVHKGCCKTKHYQVSVDSNKSFVKQVVFAPQIFAEAIVSDLIFFIPQTVAIVSVQYALPPAHAPPLIRTVPIRILHQEFLI